jgi:hypothetical protein
MKRRVSWSSGGGIPLVYISGPKKLASGSPFFETNDMHSHPSTPAREPTTGRIQAERRAPLGIE